MKIISSSFFQFSALSCVFSLVFLFFPIKESDSVKILFIGNSYTYRNDMPDIFADMAQSKGENIEVYSCTKGKANFKIQSNRKEVYSKIRSNKWDIVVLQGSSRDFVKTNDEINSETIPYFEKILKEVQLNNPNTRTLLFMTWAYKKGFKPFKPSNSYLKMTNLVKNGYLALGKKYNLEVVPVGEAWKNVRSKNEMYNLYVKDGAHPSLKGSYLAACCFYYSIFNKKSAKTYRHPYLDIKTCKSLASFAEKTVQPYFK